MDSSLKVPKEHFHMGHIGIIALVAAALVGLSMIKSGPELFSKNDPPPYTFTYDEVKNQVVAENASQPTTTNDQTDQQLAMIDPNYNSGQVLGTSTDSTGLDSVIPKAEDMLTPQVLNMIQVKTSDKSDKDSIQTYADQVTYVESHFNSLGILTDLNGTDPSQLKEAKDNATKIVQGLSLIVVPKPLEDYQKVKMMYYTTLGNMADVFAGTNTKYSVDDVASILLSLTDKLDRSATDVFNTYGVQL